MIYVVCYVYAKVGKNNHLRKRYIVDSTSKEHAIEKVRKGVHINSVVNDIYYLDKVKVKEYVERAQ